MKLNITLDLEDFFAKWDYESIEQVVIKEIKEEALKQIKKTPEYKKLVEQIKTEALNKIGL